MSAEWPSGVLWPLSMDPEEDLTQEEDRRILKELAAEADPRTRTQKQKSPRELVSEIDCKKYPGKLDYVDDDGCRATLYYDPDSVIKVTVIE